MAKMIQLFIGALVQYTMVFSIMLYMLTYMHEMKDLSIGFHIEQSPTDISNQLAALSFEMGDEELDSELRLGDDDDQLD